MPHIKHALFRGENDLKRRYADTKKKNSGKVWALVTGGSSGIGKAVALRLAVQVYTSLLLLYILPAVLFPAQVGDVYCSLFPPPLLY